MKINAIMFNTTVSGSIPSDPVIVGEKDGRGADKGKKVPTYSLAVTSAEQAYHIDNIPAALGLTDAKSRDIVTFDPRQKAVVINPAWMAQNPEFTSEVLTSKLSGFLDSKSEKAVEKLNARYAGSSMAKEIVPLFPEDGLIVMGVLPVAASKGTNAIPAAVDQHAALATLRKDHPGSYVFEGSRYEPSISPTTTGYYTTHKSVLEGNAEVAALLAPMIGPEAIAAMVGYEGKPPKVAGEKKAANPVKTAAAKQGAKNPGRVQTVRALVTENSLARKVLEANSFSTTEVAGYVEGEFKARSGSHEVAYYMMAAANTNMATLEALHKTQLRNFTLIAGRPANSAPEGGERTDEQLNLLAEYATGLQLDQKESAEIVPGLKAKHFAAATAANLKARTVVMSKTSTDAEKEAAGVIIGRTYPSSPAVETDDTRVARGQKPVKEQIYLKKRNYPAAFVSPLTQIMGRFAAVKTTIPEKAAAVYVGDFESVEAFNAGFAEWTAKQKAGGQRSGSGARTNTASSADTDARQAAIAARKKAKEDAALVAGGQSA